MQATRWFDIFSERAFMSLKSWNPTIFNIIPWVAGMKDSSTKRLMFQVLLKCRFLYKKGFHFIALWLEMQSIYRRWTQGWKNIIVWQLKVRLSQNGFTKSSILQNMIRKIWRIPSLCTIKTLRAEILQIFRVIFGSNENFQIWFWDLLTFR